MSVIYETDNFIIESVDKPHIDRNDGGHILIYPKLQVEDRTQLSPELAKEMMKLTMVVGESMKKVLNKHGVGIDRINYQENGNWGTFPKLHVHLYGRAKSSKYQKHGEALHLPKMETGFYDLFKPLNNEDTSEIRKEVNRLLQTEKYKHF